MLALAAAAGILFADHFPAPLAYPAAALLLAVISWRWRRRPFGALILGPLTALSFASVHTWHLQAFRGFPQFDVIAAEASGLHVQGRGRVLQEPRLFGSYAEQAPVELQEITLDGTTQRLRHHLLLRVSGQHTLHYGDIIEFSGRLHLPESPRNPGEFDYRSYLQRHDWVGLVDVRQGEHLEIVDRQAHPLKSMAVRARQKLAHAITRDLENEPEVCAVLNAMVLGRRDQATPELEAPFRNSGTLHLFAVSGLHVGIFALVAWLLLKPWGLGRAQVTWILIPLLFFYAFLTGWRPSAVRAATMAAVFLAGFCVHRQPRLLNSLGLAALLILASNTNQLFRLGFQLSFVVLLAITVFTRPLQWPFRRWLHHDPLVPPSLLEDYEQRAYTFRRWFGDLVGVSAAAWLGSLPFMVLTFHLLTPVAVLANALLMPLGFFILLTASLSMLCSLTGILGWANILFNNANVALVHALLATAEFFASVPSGHLHVSSRLPGTRPPLEITVLDLPRGGACTHVSVRGGPDELIDIGHANNFRFITEPYLRHAGLNQVDRLWLSHGDTSHISAGPEFLSRYSPAVYRPGWENRSPSMRSLDEMMEKRGSTPVRLRAPSSLPLSDHAYWEILYPPENSDFAPAAADDRGLVLRLRGYGWRVLFMADAGFATERWLVLSGHDLGADVLIKGSHGNDLSGLAEFLDLVQPRVLVWDSETDSSSHAAAWAAGHECLLVDQQQTGAVILGLGQGEMTVRGFRKPSEVITLTENGPGG